MFMIFEAQIPRTGPALPALASGVTSRATEPTGNGVIAPLSAGFTHTNEFVTEPCGEGQQCFVLSDALTSSFLPHRKQVLESFLVQTPCNAPSCAQPQADIR